MWLQEFGKNSDFPRREYFCKVDRVVEVNLPQPPVRAACLLWRQARQSILKWKVQFHGEQILFIILSLYRKQQYQYNSVSAATLCAACPDAEESERSPRTRAKADKESEKKTEEKATQRKRAANRVSKQNSCPPWLYISQKQRMWSDRLTSLICGKLRFKPHDPLRT